MKKMKKLFYVFVCAVMFMCVAQTTDVKAAGSDKKSAEVITHGKLYEETLEDTAQWYTFKTVDYVNYYELSATFAGRYSYDYADFVVYDELNAMVGSVRARGYETCAANIKLTPNTKYYIKVTGDKGDYSFKLEAKADAADEKASADKIVANTFYEESLVSNDVDWYTFNSVDYVNYYVVTAIYEVSGWDKYLELTIYDEDNTKVGSIRADEDGSKENIKLLPNKKYYIQVAGTIGNYSFKLEPKADIADTKEEAVAIEYNKLYEESYCVSSDEDWYKITTGTYCQNYELLLNETSDDTIRLYVYDEENTCVNRDTYVYSTYKESVTLLPNQTYYIKTVGSDGTYSLKVTPGEHFNGWYSVKNTANETKSYWYEDGLRQGTYEDPQGVLGDGTVRGREIYDPESDGWYWLDAVYDGAKAVNKEVWMPYIYQGEQNWPAEEVAMNAANSGDMAEQVIREINNRTGKWVRYDANGKMYKGWYTVQGADAKIYPDQVGNTYYYDQMTGLMAKGEVEIGGSVYYFDPITGVLQK